jgi:hypothetical protein
LRHKKRDERKYTKLTAQMLADSTMTHGGAEGITMGFSDRTGGSELFRSALHIGILGTLGVLLASAHGAVLEAMTEVVTQMKQIFPVVVQQACCRVAKAEVWVSTRREQRRAMNTVIPKARHTHDPSDP